MKQLPFFKKGLLLLCLISSTISLAQLTNLNTFAAAAAAPIVDPVDTIDPISISTDYATQINATFANLDKTRIPHKLLVDYAMEFTELSGYNGTLTPPNTLHRGHYTAIYNTLLMSRVNTTVPRLINPDLFRNNWDNLRVANKIVLSGLYYKYNEFKPNAPNNTITITNGKLYDKFVGGVWQNPYDEKQVFAMTAPILKFNNLSMQVELPAGLWYTNQASNVSSIAIDFSDGLGYQTIAFGQIKNVSYTTAGIKEWKYKLTLTNNQVLYSHSKIQIDGVPIPTQTTFNRTINQPCSINAFGIDQVEFSGVRPYNGRVANAILEIDYASTNCVISRPLFVVEGFDSGILGAENVLGENDYFDFRRESRDDTGNLPAQLNTYDIIYINFKNSRDYLQRNAYLVEDIIKWVNSIKVGTFPNVVLGQSMGGIIARYALKDMENQQALNPTVPSWQHKTSLYISHDAPHQGANTPLAIQYFSRHLIKQFVSTPLGDMNVNVSGDGAPVTISDLQRLLNSPGTKQLLIDYITPNFDFSNPIGDAWKTELRNMGYPQQTRNIAISNSNHCGTQQSFQPLDNLFTFSGNGQTSTLTDFLLQLIPFANTVSAVSLAILFNEPGLLIGILPGNSKFELDFYGKALPSAGNTNQIYHGNITFTKTLFRLFGWAPRITVTLTNVDKNAPGGLSYDYYPGGRYRSLFTNSSAGTPNNLQAFGSFGIQLTARDNFNFIPAPSALDIGGGSTPLNNSDYFRKYNSLTPPTGNRASPFVNFTTAYTQGSNQNENHISFNRRNGDWLATELDANTQTSQIFDCSYICDSNQITGNDVICTNQIFTFPNVSDASYNWTINNGANLVTLANNGTPAATLTALPNVSGAVTLNLTISSACGINSFSKIIWVGLPSFDFEYDVTPQQTDKTFVIMRSIDPSVMIEQQGITATTKTKVIDAGITVNALWSGMFIGKINPARTWLVTATATNLCGTTTFSQNPTENRANNNSTTSKLYKTYPNPTNNLIYIELKNLEQKLSQNSTIFAELFNIMGEVKRNVSINNNIATIDVNGLQKGIYILKIYINGAIESHQVGVQ